MLLSADSFNRADSSTTLGSTDGAGSLDPLAWAVNGTWGIISNRAYTPVPGDGSKAVVNLGVSDVDISVDTPVTNKQGLCLRYVNNTNNWYFVGDGSTTHLNRVVAGVDTVIASSAGGGSGPLQIVAVGSSIRCYSNGLLLYSTTDSTHLTATKHGLFNWGYSTNRFDNWAASTVDAPQPVGNFLPFFRH